MQPIEYMEKWLTQTPNKNTSKMKWISYDRIVVIEELGWTELVYEPRKFSGGVLAITIPLVGISFLFEDDKFLGILNNRKE